MLFTSIYKSWCHNAVAVFALCLLAQAYEHASALLQTLWVALVRMAVLSKLTRAIGQCRAGDDGGPAGSDRQARHVDREPSIHL